MKAKEILTILDGLKSEEQKILFIELQLDTAKLSGQIEGISDYHDRLNKVYESNE